MNEQQFHLSNLLKQRDSIGNEINDLQEGINKRREVFFKVQGAIDYLTQIGVTVPPAEEESSTQAPEAAAEETAPAEEAVAG
jgi:hypothetical protein